MIVSLRSLMELKGCCLQPPSGEIGYIIVEKFCGAWKPFVIVFPRHLRRGMWRLWLRLRQFIIDRLIKRDAIPSDIHEEVTTMGKPGIHFVGAMDDEIDRGPDCLRDAELAHQMIVEQIGRAHV